jgi:rhodanese-related sulfurtransferase
MLALVAVAGGVSAGLHPGAPSFSATRYDAGAVDAREAVTWTDALWVDAREEHEYAAGRIGEAVLLNETRWDELLAGFLDRWTPGARVIVYCGSDACPAARKVRARLMRELALFETEVFFLEGGLERWTGELSRE